SWVKLDAPLSVGPLLPATEPPLRWIQLPDHYLLTSIGNGKGLDSFLARLALALQDGLKLVQFREPDWRPESGQDVHTAFKQVVQLCHEHGARCLVNSCHPEDWWSQADGVHLRAADALALASATSDAPEHAPALSPAAVALRARVPGLIAVSAHTADDLAAARLLQADFAVLGHVLP